MSDYMISFFDGDIACLADGRVLARLPISVCDCEDDPLPCELAMHFLMDAGDADAGTRLTWERQFDNQSDILLVGALA